METTLQHIELINQYLNNALSGEAKTSFIQKLETDSEFNALYQEHSILVEGINRTVLKGEITNAKQSYTTTKWVKIAGIGIIVISTLVLLYTLLNSSTSDIEQPQPAQNDTFIQFEKTDQNPENKTVLIDSVSTIVLLDSISDEIAERTSVNLKPFPKQPQVFTFDVNKDTIIKCKEGTVLKIKANSFVHSGYGSPVKGVIDFEVTEYYKLSDMLLANLTTTSKGQQLETGGMLYVHAVQGEGLVELKPNATIDIFMPTKNKKESMQLFSGVMGGNGIDWILEDDELEALEIIDEEDIEVPFSLVEQTPVFPGCETVNEAQRRQCFSDELNRFIQMNFNSDVIEQAGLTGRQRITSSFKIDKNGDIGFIQSNAGRPELINEANRVIALLPRVQPGKQRGRNVVVPYSVPIFIQVQRADAVFGTLSQESRDRVRVSNFISTRNAIIYDSINVPLRGVVERIREIMHDADFDVNASFLQQWDQFRKENLIREFNKSSSDRKFLIKKEVFAAEGSRFKILDDDSITRGDHIIRIPWDESKVPTTSTMVQIVPKQTYYGGSEVITAEEFEDRVDDVDQNKNITITDINNYVLTTAKLGWINCDRFINGRIKRIKYKLKIKDSKNTVVNMVFKSVNSVLPSWKSNEDYDFGTVSDASEVVLVAIKKEEGRLFMDVVETKIEMNPKVDFEFKEVTLQEMKTELAKLNSLFN
ncbi:MAG: hypothetical protein ACSHXF_02250 [Aquaticitalea sp.]